jgi:hypothetical protein
MTTLWMVVLSRTLPMTSTTVSAACAGHSAGIMLDTADPLGDEGSAMAANPTRPGGTAQRWKLSDGMQVSSPTATTSVVSRPSSVRYGSS